MRLKNKQPGRPVDGPLRGHRPPGQLRQYRRLRVTDGPDDVLIATPGWLLRKAALDQVGHFDERICSWDDWEPELRLWLAYDFVVVGGGLMRMERARADDIMFIDQKHDAAVGRQPAQVRAANLRPRHRAVAVRAAAGRSRRVARVAAPVPAVGEGRVAWLLTFVPTAIGLPGAQAIRRLRGPIWMLRHR